jgi:hypothetical protein
MDPSERARIIHQGRQLVSEHEEHVKRAATQLNAPSQWKRSLNGHRYERYSKEWILIALQSENVPDQLQVRTLWRCHHRNTLLVSIGSCVLSPLV